VLVVSKGTGYVLESTKIHRPQQLCGLHLRLQRDEFVVKCKLRFVGEEIENSLYFFFPFSLPFEVSLLSQYASIVASK
jgi:hypothetical protein